MRRTIISVSLLAGLALVAAAATRASDIRVVQIADRCDSITFPPEAGCQGRGGVTFQKFLEKVNAKDGGHGAWRFHMDGGDLRMGEPLARELREQPGLELVDGAVKLADGLILIHDLERLLSLEEERAIDRALSTTAGSDAPVSGGCDDELERGAP